MIKSSLLRLFVCLCLFFVWEIKSIPNNSGQIENWTFDDFLDSKVQQNKKKLMGQMPLEIPASSTSPNTRKGDVKAVSFPSPLCVLALFMGEFV